MEELTQYNINYYKLKSSILLGELYFYIDHKDSCIDDVLELLANDGKLDISFKFGNSFAFPGTNFIISTIRCRKKYSEKLEEIFNILDHYMLDKYGEIYDNFALKVIKILDDVKKGAKVKFEFVN